MKTSTLVATLAAAPFAPEALAQSADAALTLGRVQVHQHGEGQLSAH